MSDVIQVHDQYYILATASRAVSRTAVLKHDDTFALFDESGDVSSLVAGEQGLYHEGTRFLSRFQLRLNGQRPLVLGARVKEDNELFGVDLTNPDLPIGTEGLVLARDLVHLFRSRFLWNATWHERLRLWNYSREPIHVSLSFGLDADFADIFEVRGTPRERRGVRHEPVVAGHEMRFSYTGLDHEERWTVVEWSEAPQVDGAGAARFDYDLAPQASAQLSVAIRCERERRPAPPAAYEIARDAAAAALEQQRGGWAEVETSSERYNQWIRRSAADLRMLISRTPDGEYPYAGVPWFSTPFGRDGIITGLQTLWVNPRIARGVLGYLAATQADRVSAVQDAEPGKILHETRNSEMARLGEVPFGQYYGSVDATPLFVVLAGDYFARTHDLAFLKRLWPHVERALEWIDTYGDRDGDGFVEYARRTPTGLVQQGWKDSQDSVFHADGSLAEAPIALCEVQAYVYAARIRAAALADTLGLADRAHTLRRQAEQLRLAFEERFWLDDQSIYALALDGEKRPCRVRSSNAGHCLFGGIAAADRARRVGEQLVGPEMFSGWGIRTLATGESRYNPMSYHNGSIWPHDNGLIAEGLSLYGFQDLLAGPAGALFEASIWMDRHRLPELFCGFHRRDGEGPTRYPVACSPQAWSSGVVFQLLQASLRLEIDAARPRLSIHATALPPFLTWIRVHNLALPFGEADLLFEQHQRDIGVTVLRKQGRFEICVLK